MTPPVTPRLPVYQRILFSVHQDPEGGGISDKPGDEPDIFHTFFGIAGLSLLGTDGVEPIDAAHAMPLKVMQRLRKKQQDERKA